MAPQATLADVLQSFIAQELRSVADVAALSDVPKETLKNWLEGKVRRPQQWQGLIKVAAVLHLDEEQTDRVLQAAQHPAVRDLRRRTLSEQDRALLVPWAENTPPALARTFEPALLAAARQQVARLPLDAVPVPAALPPGSHMPLRSNPLFVGRVDAFQTLARFYKAGTDEVDRQGVTAAVAGLGGMGKTQLAAEWAHRYGQFFVGGIFWLSFDTPDGVPLQVARCGGVGGLELRPDFAALALDEQVRLVVAAWQSPLPRLLVFDNCEDEGLLARWCPTTGGASVLVTTRRAHWDVPPDIHLLPLPVLQRRESVALVRKHRPDLVEDDPQLDALAAELGDLPLAMHLAGRFLARYRHAPSITPATYLTQLRSPPLLAHPSLRGDDVSPTGHGQWLLQAFALSYARLCPDEPVEASARALLTRTAYFAPGELIPRDLLAATLTLPNDVPAAVLHIEDALIRLIELGLLEMGVSGGLRLHRLVAAFVRSMADDPHAQTAVEQTLLQRANQHNAAGEVVPMRAWQEHLRSVAHAARPRADELGAELCNALGYHVWLAGEFVDAQRWLEFAVAIYAQRFGCDDLKTVEALEMLGLVFQMQADYGQAQSLFEQVLVLRQQHQGSDHPDTATTHNNLGYLLLHQPHYQLGLVHVWRALKLRKQCYGLYHLETARALRNVGYGLFRQGRYRDARRFFELTLRVMACVSPGNHSITAQTLEHLANVLVLQSEDAQAGQRFEQLLVIRRTLLGDDNYDIGNVLTSLAVLRRRQGDYGQARAYLEQALAIYERTVGTNHREAAGTLEEWGKLLQTEGNYSEAQAFFERALVCLEQTLGDQHPDAASQLNNLGSLSLAQGHHASAQQYFDQALAIRIEVLGVTHPDTASTLNNLGLLFQRQGQPAQARQYFQQVLPIYAKTFGVNHPHTHAVQTNLAMLDPLG